MPDHVDHADLSNLLSQPERWTVADADQARLFREQQAAAAAGFDQRDATRVAAMWRVVKELDDALAVWESSR